MPVISVEQQMFSIAGLELINTQYLRIIIALRAKRIHLQINDILEV